jgi:glycosyltransferase involved in cell wall biosynthesis
MSRVLMIAYSTYIRDGRVKRHAEALADRGDHVDVICLWSDQLRSGNGVNLIGVKVPRYRGASRAAYIRSYLLFFAHAAVLAWRSSKSKRYDVAIVCSMPDAVIVCAAPLRFFGTRLILDVHDTMPELYLDKFPGRKGALGARVLKIEERTSASIANRVLVVHEPHRQRLQAAGIPREKIRVVLNSPDPKIFSPPAYGHRANQSFTVVCHGTITRRLGLDIALQAVGLMREKIPPLQLMVLGDGDYLEDAKNLASAMKLNDRVTFCAPVPIEKLPALLRQADIGLVPNRPSAATHLMLPVKMMEYAALGIPVIAARLRTIEYYFGEGGALFFDAGNPAALAAAIENLYLNRDRAKQFASRAMEIVEGLSWQLHRDHLFCAVDEVA